MTTAMPLLSVDDNMGFGTPNFFSSAWNQEQNDFSFIEAFARNHSGYTPQLLQGQAENNQLDYFSGQVESQYGSQSTYQPRQSSGLSQSHEDLDRILENSATALVEKNVDAAGPISMFDHPNQAGQVRDFNAYHNPLYTSAGMEVSTINDWNADIKQTASPAKIMTQVNNETDRRTSLRNGQLTPVESPPDDSALIPHKAAKQSTSAKNKIGDSASSTETPKVKKPRKSKKKPMTREQEESKRKKFLERNRVAADKCRQNRKKWIDDLQTKAHYFSADNTAKQGQLEELEQEVVQLKSLLFIHSRSCNQNDIGTWVEQEANRVQLLSERGGLEGKLSLFAQNVTDAASSPSSRPTSSRGFGSVSEAVSRRYSDATAGDDYVSAVSAQSSRRPSVAI